MAGILDHVSRFPEAVKMAKRVAIIGAGASGLACIKCCLDEDLEPVCFEKGNDIGGLWNFQEDVTDGKASIYKSLIINTSKEMMCYSDFPVHEDYPNYMHHSKIMEYFRQYAARFNLLKYIRFATSVCNITQRTDFSTTGQWDVETRGKEGNLETTTFDAILVCVGHHAYPHLPLDTFPGIEKFKGQYMHSRDYKGPQKFEGKRVVVVGIGNSGVDLAVEISQHAKQVFLSTRRGAWVVNRVSKRGYPGDVIASCRVFRLLGLFLLEQLIQQYINSRFDHGNYGLQPSHSFFSQHPTLNDDLPNRILSGRVLVKPNVKQFTESAAIFEDGTVEDIDAVIFATGYSFAFPFLNESVIKVNRNQATLYKNVFPPQLEQPTLAIIGLVQPLGAIMPVSEMQARWVTRVFKGLVKLPPVNNMIADSLEKKEIMAKRYVSSQRHTIQVDYISYMDEIAELIGVKPNIKHLLLTDPQLAFQVFFGPCTPYQFRLMGPGKWPKARETILTQWHRIIKPSKTRVVPSSQQNASWPILLKFLPVLVALCAVYLFLY